MIVIYDHYGLRAQISFRLCVCHQFSASVSTAQKQYLPFTESHLKINFEID
jgi:hypothetical protein